MESGFGDSSATAALLLHICVASNDVANFRYSNEDADAPECEELCVWARSLECRRSGTGAARRLYERTLLPRNPVA